MDLWNSNSVLATNNKKVENEIEPDRLRAIINSSDLNKVLEVIQKKEHQTIFQSEKLYK